MQCNWWNRIVSNIDRFDLELDLSRSVKHKPVGLVVSLTIWSIYKWGVKDVWRYDEHTAITIFWLDLSIRQFTRPSAHIKYTRYNYTTVFPIIKYVFKIPSMWYSLLLCCRDNSTIKHPIYSKPLLPNLMVLNLGTATGTAALDSYRVVSRWHAYVPGRCVLWWPRQQEE